MVLLVASAAAALSCAGQAAAQDRWTGWQLDAFVGNTTESSSSDDQYFDNVEPTGTTYGIGGSYRTVLFDDLVVGVEASAAIGSVEDWFTETTCTVSVCGFNEEVTYTVKSSYSARLGVSLGHEFGPVLISGLAGIEVRDRGILTEVETSDPDNEDYFYDQTWAAFGPYYGLRVEYALTDRITIGGQLTRSDVVQSIIEFDDGDVYEDGAEYTEGQIRLSMRF
ncbi:MAG: outer membrane beta-barrel protein [Patescibacteria group bacterium]